jgi:hypothetical protein
LLNGNEPERKPNPVQDEVDLGKAGIFHLAENAFESESYDSSEQKAKRKFPDEVVSSPL